MTERYFTIANIMLLTAAVFLCVKSFYTFVTPRPDYTVAITAAQRPVSSPPTHYSKPPAANYNKIVQRNIFNSGTGEVAPEARARSVDIEKLKQTDLKLKLWGTVTGQNGRAYAVIEDTKTRQQNLYHTGDTIQNAVVKMILREKVVLNVDNSDEILAMEETRGRRGGAGSSKKRVGSADSSDRKLPVSRYPRKIKLRGDQIQNAMENLGQLMEQANLRPHIQDGQPAGISITGIKPNAIFRKMRLRNGDVITGVNGNSVASVEDAVRIFEELSSGSNIQLQIKRRGREQTLDYNIE